MGINEWIDEVEEFWEKLSREHPNYTTPRSPTVYGSLKYFARKHGVEELDPSQLTDEEIRRVYEFLGWSPPQPWNRQVAETELLRELWGGYMGDGIIFGLWRHQNRLYLVVGFSTKENLWKFVVYEV